jgi:hypothetical protein
MIIREFRDEPIPVIRRRSFIPLSITVFTVSMSGGLQLGGSNGATLGFSAAGAGGLLTGGSNPPGITFAPAGTGGIELGGSNSPGIIFAPSGSGGIELGGSNVPGVAFAQNSNGGILLGGSNTPIPTFVLTSLGGLQLGGSAGNPGVTFSPVGSGGLQVGGSNGPGVTFAMAGSGGVALGGSNAPTATFTKIASGGVLVGGSNAPTVILGTSLVYHVYSNNGAGGPIDWTTVIATVSTLTWTASALADSSDTTFAVRAYNASLSLEEKGVTTTVRLRIDASGNDLSAVPAAPAELGVRQSAAGLLVSWAYVAPPATALRPTGFHVYRTTGSTVNFASTPVATIAYSYTSPSQSFHTTLTGLVNGTTYAIGVRSYNGSGTDQNVNQVTIVASLTAPRNVDDLTGVATTTRPRI